MEKKTIGKFISALRRANGMTQKELGDKLYVSDKTVSRWECDECLPELSLIPAIAEIFGITTDELLRGQKNSPDSDDASREDRQRARSDKQFKMMLHKNGKKFSNLSFISIGLIAAGIIAAMICNLGLNESILGGCLALLFFIAATICQICFTNAFTVSDYEDEHESEVMAANTATVEKTVKIIFGIITATLFCLPLLIFGGSHYGLVFDSWSLYGLLLSAIGFIISFCIYKIFILPTLIKNGTITYNDIERKNLEKNTQLLKKISKISSIILLVTLVLAIVNSIIDEYNGYAKEYVFDDFSEYKEFVQNDYDEWYDFYMGGTVDLDENGNVVGSYPKMHIEHYVDSSGSYETNWVYLNPDLYKYTTHYSHDDGTERFELMRIEDYNNAQDVYYYILDALLIVAALTVATSVAYYCIKTYKKEK